MKRFSLIWVAAAAFSLNAQASALPTSTTDAAFKILRQIDLQDSIQNLINWQVGDFHKIKIAMMFGNGSGTKEATKEEGNAIWLVTDMSILGQNQKSEALINRADGKVLKLIVNGKEENPNEGGEVEIIEQKETSVTVGAGTFECIYVKAKMTAQGQTQDIELWANPIDVNLDGSLKVVVQTTFGPITITLEQFGKK